MLRQVSAQHSLVEGCTVKTMAASLVAVSAITATAGETPWLATGICNDVKGKEPIERSPKFCIYIIEQYKIRLMVASSHPFRTEKKEKKVVYKGRRDTRKKDVDLSV
jgi:hypothetical protein